MAWFHIQRLFGGSDFKIGKSGVEKCLIVKKKAGKIQMYNLYNFNISISNGICSIGDRICLERIPKCTLSHNDIKIGWAEDPGFESQEAR